MYLIVVESISCFSGSDGRIGSQSTHARAWHTVQLVPPASEPFKPTLLCLKQSICSHFPGIVTPIEFKFTSSVAAASFPSVWCLKELGGVNIFFLFLFGPDTYKKIVYARENLELEAVLS